MRTIKTNKDGSLEITVTDTRTVEQKLNTLSFKDRLDALYPTEGVDEITSTWMSYDDHKFNK